MSTSTNHTKAFVQCCHGKHTVASSRTLLSDHVILKYIRIMRCVGLDWIHMTQDRDHGDELFSSTSGGEFLVKLITEIFKKWFGTCSTSGVLFPIIRFFENISKTKTYLKSALLSGRVKVLLRLCEF